ASAAFTQSTRIGFALRPAAMAGWSFAFTSGFNGSCWPSPSASFASTSGLSRQSTSCRAPARLGQPRGMHSVFGMNRAPSRPPFGASAGGKDEAHAAPPFPRGGGVGGVAHPPPPPLPRRRPPPGHPLGHLLVARGQAPLVGLQVGVEPLRPPRAQHLPQ